MYKIPTFTNQTQVGQQLVPGQQYPPTTQDAQQATRGAHALGQAAVGLPSNAPAIVVPISRDNIHPQAADTNQLRNQLSETNSFLDNIISFFRTMFTNVVAYFNKSPNTPEQLPQLSSTAESSESRGQVALQIDPPPPELSSYGFSKEKMMEHVKLVIAVARDTNEIMGIVHFPAPDTDIQSERTGFWFKREFFAYAQNELSKHGIRVSKRRLEHNEKNEAYLSIGWERTWNIDL